MIWFDWSAVFVTTMLAASSMRDLLKRRALGSSPSFYPLFPVEASGHKLPGSKPISWQMPRQRVIDSIKAHPSRKPNVRKKRLQRERDLLKRRALGSSPSFYPLFPVEASGHKLPGSKPISWQMPRQRVIDPSKPIRVESLM